MGKIRGIHPEFWTDEDIVELTLPARLLFIGLWNIACDNGHLDDKPKQIKMRVLPSDDVDIDALLDELAWHKRIDRTDGTITIRKFAEHQKPHKRWWKCCGPTRPDCVVPEDAPPQGRNGGKGSLDEPDNGGATVAQPERTVVPGSATADCDGEGDGDGDTTPKGVVVSDGAKAPRPKKTRTTTTRHSFADFEPSATCRRIATERGIDLADEYVKLRDWATANAEKKADWQATFRNWLRNAKVSPPTRPGGNTNGFLADLRAGGYGPEAIG